MDKLNRKIKEDCKPKTSWWRRNGYKVWRIILFPIYFILLTHKAYKEWQIKRQKRDRKKDDEILTAFLYKTAEVNEGCLWFSPDWHYFSIRLNGWLGFKYRYYLEAFKYILYKDLIKTWTPPTFVRIEERDTCDDIWIKFIPKETWLGETK